MLILDRIEANSYSPSNIYKALLESAKELKEYSKSDNHRYIIAFTDTVD